MDVGGSPLLVPQINHFLQFFHFLLSHLLQNGSYRLLVAPQVILISGFVRNFFLNEFSISLFNDVSDRVRLFCFLCFSVGFGLTIVSSGFLGFLLNLAFDESGNRLKRSMSAG